MQFLFSRPYFHVFFKPVITVLSKKSQSDGCSWGKRYSRVLESLLWVLTAGLQSAAWFTVTLHFCNVRTRPALSGPRRQACFLSPETKTKERSGVQFQCTTYQEENSRCAPVLRVFQREAGKEFHVCILVFILFSLTESFKLLFFSVLFNSVSLYIASFFFYISSECCFMSNWGRNKLHMCVSNHRWCFYLTSFWISCVLTGSFLRQKEEAEVKETWSSHKTDVLRVGAYSFGSEFVLKRRRWVSLDCTLCVCKMQVNKNTAVQSNRPVLSHLEESWGVLLGAGRMERSLTIGHLDVINSLQGDRCTAYKSFSVSLNMFACVKAFLTFL